LLLTAHPAVLLENAEQIEASNPAGGNTMPESKDEQEQPTTTAQDVARVALGLMLVSAGLAHLTFARKPFRAQVPPWLPIDPDTVVLGSGITEIALGAALLGMPAERTLVGRVAGAFFVAIFPGNVAQYTHHRSAFGLDTDTKRFSRLFFQPVLVAWALWCTGALQRTRLRTPR